MNKFIVMSFCVVCLVGVAHADMYTFDFNTLFSGDNIATTETYMESIYGSDIAIISGDSDGIIISNGSTTHELGPDMWVKIDNGTSNGEDGIKISFNVVPITSVSFEWGTESSKFYAEADNVKFFSRVASSSGHGTVSTYTFASPVTTLYFHDSGNGWIGFDNLIVTTAGNSCPVDPPAVPVPGAVFLGILGLSAAGIKLRNKS